MKGNQRWGSRGKAIALVGLIGLVAGCTVPKYNYVPSVQHLSEPAIGSINTAYIGDSLIRQGTVSDHDGIRLTGQFKTGMLGYTLMPGDYLKQGEDADAEFFLPGGQRPGQVVKPPLADAWQSVMVRKREPGVCVVSVFNVSQCAATATYQRIKATTDQSASFQQALLYNGRVGNKINIGYREFSSNMARPAFNNDVEYDLEASNVIGYKGARIEVLRATNESIQYRVLQNFSTNR